MRVQGIGVWGLALAVSACDPLYSYTCADGYADVDGSCVAPDGGVVDAAGDDVGPRDVGVDGGPCASCSGATPVCASNGLSCVGCNTSADCSGRGALDVCDTRTNTCVECVSPSDCSAPRGLCDVTRGACVGCLSGADCTTAGQSRCDAPSQACAACMSDTDCTRLTSTPHCAAPGGALTGCVACNASTDCSSAASARCDTATGTCSRCTADADCAHLSATPVCNETTGACAACTIDSEAARCGLNSCDPMTLTCTTTPRGSVLGCAECTADSECIDGYACVRQTFMSMPVGNFCMPIARTTVPFCSRPFFGTAEVTSLSGAAITACTLRVTTCPALRDFSNRSCMPAMNGSDCGAIGIDDGRCRRAGNGTDRCTTPCGGDDDCRPGFGCTGAIGNEACSL